MPPNDLTRYRGFNYTDKGENMSRGEVYLVKKTEEMKKGKGLWLSCFIKVIDCDGLSKRKRKKAKKTKRKFKKNRSLYDSVECKSVLVFSTFFFFLVCPLSRNKSTTQPLLTQAYILFHAKIVTNITSVKPNAI